ncbi:GTPase activating protein (GAP) for Rho1p [Marasmius crinis-equi]|uniref:GTPase activating protein (GAP) for Rho1p n=1 Tax=Marasmius crinis-equi TaxID=585013 RepID=A0ABR3FDX6_9AGAR
MTEYMREAIVWQQLRHPNLLPFLGMYYLDKAREQLCLVSPWMETGNLAQYLKNTPRDSVDHESLAYDVAAGLCHLHGMKIVHGDLKGVNILLSPNGRATIADFGLSRVADTHTLRLDTSTSAQAKGTTRWLSPELLRQDPPCSTSTSSDIYAYACVCYEIFSGNIPFRELVEGAVVVAVLIDKKQPSRPEVSELTDTMWEIMTLCWAYDPALRPTATDVLGRIGPIESMRTLSRLESYPALDWDPLQLTNIWKNVKYPAVDTMEFLRVLGRDQLPLRAPAFLVSAQNVHTTHPSPSQSSNGAIRDGRLVHEERTGSEKGFWKRVGAQRRKYSPLTTPDHGSLPDEPAHTVFGKLLQEIPQHARTQISTANANGELFVWGYVPVVVAKCGLYLKENATEVEDVFRLFGSNERIRELQANFETPPRYGKSLDWRQLSYTPYEIAGVFRRYLASMPEPVIPYELHRDFRDAITKDPFNTDEAISNYKRLIRGMPEANQYLLLYVLDLLLVFARKSDKNLMSATALAAIFQPSLISHSSHGMTSKEYNLGQRVLEFLIEQNDWFMLDIPPPSQDELNVSRRGATTTSKPAPVAEPVFVTAFPTSDEEPSTAGGWMLVSSVGRRKTMADRDRRHGTLQ